jgi:hypothetical protein
MKSRTAGILLLALAVAGCRDSGNAPEQPAEQAAPKINIRFDLTEYRKLANRADDITVGTIVGTRTKQVKAPAGTVTDLAVRVRPADGPEQVELFRTDTKATTELLKHQGQEYLFFWRSVAPGKDDRALEILAYFPLDEKNRQVLTWMKGAAKQYTLFDPASKSELPPGLEVSSRVVMEDKVQWLMVRFTNRSKEAVVMAAGVDSPPWTSTRVTGPEGEVVWRGWQIIVTNSIGCAPKYVTLAPGESMDTRACCFAMVGQKLDFLDTSMLRLTRGKHHFRFIYDSKGCETYEGQTPLKARMVVYGSFEVAP